jgi:hypothetical protein
LITSGLVVLQAASRLAAHKAAMTREWRERAIAWDIMWSLSVTAVAERDATCRVGSPMTGKEVQQVHRL